MGKENEVKLDDAGKGIEKDGDVSLATLVGKHLDTLGIDYERNKNVFKMKCKGKYSKPDLFIVAEKSQKGTKSIMFMNFDYLGIHLDDLDREARNRVAELALELNDRFTAIRFGIEKGVFLTLKTEIPVIDKEPSVELFEYFLNGILAVGDHVYPDFARIMFSEGDQAKKATEASRDGGKMDYENVEKIMDGVGLEISLMTMAHKALVRVLQSKQILTAQELVDESRTVVKEAQAHKAALN